MEEKCQLAYIGKVEQLHPTEGAGMALPKLTELPSCVVCSHWIHQTFPYKKRFFGHYFFVSDVFKYIKPVLTPYAFMRRMPRTYGRISTYDTYCPL